MKNSSFRATRKQFLELTVRENTFQLCHSKLIWFYITKSPFFRTIHTGELFLQYYSNLPVWEEEGRDKKHGIKEKHCCSGQMGFSCSFPPFNHSLDLLLYPLNIQAEWETVGECWQWHSTGSTLTWCVHSASSPRWFDMVDLWFLGYDLFFHLGSLLWKISFQVTSTSMKVPLNLHLVK